MTFKIKTKHYSNTPGYLWCDPIGWNPKNPTDDYYLDESVIWDDDEEVAGLGVLALGRKEGEELEVSLADLAWLQSNSMGGFFGDGVVQA